MHNYKSIKQSFVRYMYGIVIDIYEKVDSELGGDRENPVKRVDAMVKKFNFLIINIKSKQSHEIDSIRAELLRKFSKWYFSNNKIVVNETKLANIMKYMLIREFGISYYQLNVAESLSQVDVMLEKILSALRYVMSSKVYFDKYERARSLIKTKAANIYIKEVMETIHGVIYDLINKYIMGSGNTTVNSLYSKMFDEHILSLTEKEITLVDFFSDLDASFKKQTKSNNIKYVSYFDDPSNPFITNHRAALGIAVVTEDPPEVPKFMTSDEEPSSDMDIDTGVIDLIEEDEEEEYEDYKRENEMLKRLIEDEATFKSKVATSIGLKATSNDSEILSTIRTLTKEITDLRLVTLKQKTEIEYLNSDIELLKRPPVHLDLEVQEDRSLLYSRPSVDEEEESEEKVEDEQEEQEDNEIEEEEEDDFFGMEGLVDDDF